MAEKSLVKSFTPMVAPEAEPEDDDPDVDEPDDEVPDDDDDEDDDEVAEPDADPDADPDVDDPDVDDPDVEDPDDEVPDDEDDDAGDDAEPLPDDDAALPLPVLPLLPQAASTMLAATSAARTAPLFLATDLSPLTCSRTDGDDAADRELPMCDAQCCRTDGRSRPM